MINHDVQHKQESVQKFNGYPNYIDILNSNKLTWKYLAADSLLLGLITKFKTDYNDIIFNMITIKCDLIIFITENGNMLFIVVDYSQAKFYYDDCFSDQHS